MVCRIETLRDRVAVVTGAASGIGFALCERLAAEGMHVVLADLDANAVRAAAERIGGAALAVRADVSRWEDVEALERAAVERFGAVHLLCNNAGVTLVGRAWRFSVEEWRWLLGVNLFGVVHGVHAFVPGMVERGEPAHVVNTASVAGLLGFPSIAAYSTSKFAVVGLSESLLHDLRAKGAPVGVSVICPGAVDTPLRDHSAQLRLGAESGAGAPADPNGATRTSPAVVADLAVDAILEDRFWVLPHPAYVELVEQRTRGIAETGAVVPGDWL
jgi:NAD(P)-dependent dehydrogenase (short-subunit alcohol dehydrogenase family)